MGVHVQIGVVALKFVPKPFLLSREPVLTFRDVSCGMSDIHIDFRPSLHVFSGDSWGKPGNKAIDINMCEKLSSVVRLLYFIP